MIPIKEAVENAVRFAPGVLDSARTASIMLEEVESGIVGGGNEVWLITLSLPDPDIPLRLSGNRQYKTFTVDGQTGEFFR
jgi:hypothetical protein